MSCGTPQGLCPPTSARLPPQPASQPVASSSVCSSSSHLARRTLTRVDALKGAPYPLIFKSALLEEEKLGPERMEGGGCRHEFSQSQEDSDSTLLTNAVVTA